LFKDLTRLNKNIEQLKQLYGNSRKRFVASNAREKRFAIDNASDKKIVTSNKRNRKRRTTNNLDSRK